MEQEELNEVNEKLDIVNNDFNEAQVKLDEIKTI